MQQDAVVKVSFAAWQAERLRQEGNEAFKHKVIPLYCIDREFAAPRRRPTSWHTLAIPR